jgi:hypothetical protein
MCRRLNDDVSAQAALLAACLLLGASARLSLLLTITLFSFKFRAVKHFAPA